MHEEILADSQVKLLQLVKNFSSEFNLVGGTAMALQLGHRRSIDFDLFTPNDFDVERVKAKIRSNYKIEETLVELHNQITMVVNGVRFTFYKYPFDIDYSESFEDVIKLPNLLTLGAMKAFALAHRAKWKDYVDLYFIFKKFSISEVSKKAEELFDGEFNEKLFREQLSYFEDINYSEKVDFLTGFEVEDDIVKESLKEISLQKN